MGTNTVPTTVDRQDIVIGDMSWGERVHMGHFHMRIPPAGDRRPIQQHHVAAYTEMYLERMYICTCIYGQIDNLVCYEYPICFEYPRLLFLVTTAPFIGKSTKRVEKSVFSISF